MKRKSKKVIFLSSLLGCSTLIASGFIVSSCSGKISTQDLNETKPIITNPTTSLSENQNINDEIDLDSSITKNDLTENKNTNDESSVTSTQDDSKINSPAPLSKDQAIFEQIGKCDDPLKFNIGWYRRSGNAFTINLKSIKGDSPFQNPSNLSWIPNLRLFAVNLPYKLKLTGKNPQNATTTNSNPYYPGIITTSQGKYHAEYDYKNIELNYVYNSLDTNNGYFDGANYGHHLYSNYGFRFNHNYNNNDNEVTFNINLPPVLNPAAKNNGDSVTEPYQFNEDTTFYTSGYMFMLKWWNDSLNFSEQNVKCLETKLQEALKNYFSKMYGDEVFRSVNKRNIPLSLTSFFIRYNNSGPTNDPINHWQYDGHGYYGQWIADSIFRDELKKL